MPKKILVIDDDPKMLVLEKTILVQGGFSVETASDGVEGLEKLQVGRYDGIILDVDRECRTKRHDPRISFGRRRLHE